MKTKEKIKQNKAITLIALVITIIILLILATIAIVELRNTKLFNKTIEARDKYKQSAEEENNTLDDYANKINVYSGGISKTETINNIPQKEACTLQDIQVSQVVSYTPDDNTGTNPTDQSYEKRDNEDSCYRVTGENWKVISKDETNNTFSITTINAPIGTVYLYGYSAFTNGESYLNNLCRYYYSSSISTEARSITLNDKTLFQNAGITVTPRSWIATKYDYGGWHGMNVVTKDSTWGCSGNDMFPNGQACAFGTCQAAYGYLHGQHTTNNATEWGCSCAIRPVVTIKFDNSIKKLNEIIYVN